MLEEIFQVLLNAIPEIVAIMVGYGVVYVKMYIDKKVKNENYNMWLDDIVGKLQDAVNLTAQEYTSSLKGQQGSLTDEQQKIAFEKAKDKFLSSIDETSKVALGQIYGNLDKWVEDKVNIYLGSSKL